MTSGREPAGQPAERAIRPRREIELMAGYHSPQVSVEVRLNTNESPVGPPLGYLTELSEAVRSLQPNRYPDRSATMLRASIANHHGVAVENVFCANGSNEVLQCLFLAFGGPGRAALLFEPTYRLHRHIAGLAGTAVLEGRRDDEFLIDPDATAVLLAELARTGDIEPSITMVCSPNNPTGIAESPRTVARLAEIVPGLLVVDEAYGQFARWSALELLDRRQVVVVRTFSKTWALAAMRLGYLVADPEVVLACEAVALPYHLDALKQLAGVIALRYEPEMRERVSRLIEARGALCASLSELPVVLWPSEANFVLFRLPGRDASEVWGQLVARSILVRDVSSWPGLSGCLRVTVGTEEENTRFLSALSEILGPSGRPAPHQ